MATLKQKKVLAKVVENGGNVSRAMIESGYSPATAKSPHKVTKSKGWKELMEKYLPDSHLGKKHREFLDAPRLVRVFKKGELETEVEETDPSAVKALDLAYKIKGKYGEEATKNNILIVNVSKETADKYGLNETSSGSSSNSN